MDQEREPEALPTSDGMFRALFESSPDGILIVDPQTLRAILFNDAACQQLGYTRDEFARLAITDYEAIESAAEVKSHVAAALRDGHAEFDTRQRTKGGELRDMHVWVRTLVLRGRTMFYAIVRDITERVRVEQALRLSALHLERSQRVAQIGHWSADFRSGAGVWSDETRRIYGVGPETPATFQAFLALVHPDDRPLVQAWVDAALSRRPPVAIHFRVIRPDGTERFIEGHGEAEFDDAGQPVAMFGTAMDVTERRRARAALIDSEAKLRTLFEAAHDAIFLMDSETFLDCNRRTEALFGRPKSEIVGRSPIDFSPAIQPDGQPSAHSAARRIAEAMAGRPQLFSWTHLRGDGTTFDAEVSLNRIDIQGQPLLQAIVRDVTDRTRAIEDLHHSEILLEETGRLARVGGWELDVEKNTLRWTSEVFSIHEIDSTTPPSVQQAIEYYAPEGRPVIDSAVRAAIEQGTPFDVELPMVTASGRRIWVRSQGSAERVDGKVTRVYGAFQEVTERRRAEEAMRLQSAALNAAGDAIVITNREGHIEWINAAFTELTGYSLEEAAGRTPGELIGSGTHPPQFFRELWGTILDGRTWRGEIVNRTKSGELYTESQSVTPIRDDAGAITHFVAIKEDISERLRLEAQFRQAQKMESVGHLASGVAHDFNNLLTVINGLTELMLEQIVDNDSLRHDVEEIHRAGERAATLTRQLLAFSRQQILAPKVVSLNTIVSGLESLLRRLLGEDIEFTVAVAPDLGAVKADPGQLEQVITNLAVNARDAMPQGGRLTIWTRNTDVADELATGYGTSLPRGSYVELAVADTGIGMDEATQVRIFEPFFTTKGLGRGTGLGLSTVYGIVKQSQGFVRVTSAVGRGTTFTIYLPQVLAAVPAAEELPARALTGVETVLVVEDNGGLRALTRRFLERGGYVVLDASGGTEAIELLQRETRPVQLLLTDVVMPGLSGRELAEEAGRMRPGIRTLYMSGYTSDAVVRHGVLESTVAYISKPFTAQELLHKVREVLD